MKKEVKPAIVKRKSLLSNPEPEVAQLGTSMIANPSNPRHPSEHPALLARRILREKNGR